MRLRLDTEQCTGHLRCLQIADDMFAADDRGIAYLLNDGMVPAGREEAAALAVKNCPERAIYLDDDSTNRPG